MENGNAENEERSEQHLAASGGGLSLTGAWRIGDAEVAAVCEGNCFGGEVAAERW